MRTLATQANLSSGAPYHHFSSRRKLLLALAVHGFDLLNGIGEEIVEKNKSDPRRALSELAYALINFSTDHSNLFDLMYESELTNPVDPALRPAFRRAFDLVVEAVERAGAGLDRNECVVRALSFWSSLFGLTRLLRHELLEPVEPAGEKGWRDAIIDDAVAAALRAGPE